MQCGYIASTLIWSCINMSWWNGINHDIRLFISMLWYGINMDIPVIQFHISVNVILLHCINIGMKLYQYLVRLHQHWYEADFNSILIKSHISIDAVWDCINIDMRFCQPVTPSRSGCFRVYNYAHYLGGNFVEEQHLNKLQNWGFCTVKFDVLFQFCKPL